MALKIGESVVVKSGIVDPDFGTDIGGWQGRVKEVDDDTVFIEWDSITLRNMGMDLVIRCENENLDWEVMTLSQREVERTNSRDSERDVEAVAASLRYEMIDDPRLDAEHDA
ncbi:conserved domain protein [delta proteobacterium NaphS2]|nr:conserved domain protein [delta proteobacterium NaphS2]